MALEPLSFLTNAQNNSIVENAILRIEAAIEKQISFQPEPFIFIKSNNNNLSSNVNDGVLILPGTKVPALHRATVKDFNVNFTTAAGTVRLVILSPDNTIRIDILRSISSSTNGIGETVLEEGEALAVVGQTAGAGIFSIYCSGSKQRVR